MRYAVDLTPDDNDTILVTSRDFRELTSFGDDVDDALRRGLDALESAIMGRMSGREPIPAPRAKGLHYVELSSLSAAKVQLYRAMLAQKLRKADLVRLLGWKPVQVDRLFNLNHASRLDQLEQAFRALGKRLEIGVKNVA